MSLSLDIEPCSIGVAFSGQGVTKRTDIYDYLNAVAGVNEKAVIRNLRLMADASGLPLVLYHTNRDETVLGNTQVVQAFLGAAHLAASDILKARIPEFEGVTLTAGHSSGEMAAMIFSELYPREDGIMLMAERGRIMHDIAVARPSGLFIPLGLNREGTEMVVSRTKQQITDEDEVIALALVNDTALNVLGATQKTLLLARSIALQHGVRRNLPIDSEGAWHTPVMEKAVELFAVKMTATPQYGVRFPVALNNGSISTDPETIRFAHLNRFTHTSEWLTAVKRFALKERIILVGPGGRIPGFNKANGFQPSQLVSFFDLVRSDS